LLSQTLSDLPPLLDVDQVSFCANGTIILDRVCWRVESGQHWAVLGPNGSGKTTLLRIATGFLWPTSGVVRRLGRELLDLGELRKSIGWISSELVARIPPGESARMTVVSGRFAQVGFKNLPWLQPTVADHERARLLLDRLGCGALADRAFGVLSQGEKQKVLIARARMAEPLLLVLDEPCAGMDPGARERLLAAIEELACDVSAPTIILVTHHVEEIMPSLTQTLVMGGGRTVASGLTRKIATPANLAAVYGVGVDRIEESGGRLWPIWGTGQSTG
jgi:iron complex transport system ATP-binding protein